MPFWMFLIPHGQVIHTPLHFWAHFLEIESDLSSLPLKSLMMTQSDFSITNYLKMPENAKTLPV